MHKLSILAITLGAGCSSFDPDLGGAPFLCGTSEPRCPGGYACEADGAGKEVCISTNGAAFDAAPIGFQCADDSALEGVNKNDTIETAFITPIDNPKIDYTLSGLAIRPDGDKDTYAVNLTMGNKGIKVISNWDSGMPVAVSILNAGGTSIVNGTDDGPNGLKACAPNLPPGAYFVQASAGVTVKNNYKLHILVVDNCAP